MSATLATACGQISGLIAAWETQATVLEKTAAALSKGRDRYPLHAARARASARTLRENAAALRRIAGPEPLCLLGHGPAKREEAAA